MDTVHTHTTGPHPTTRDRTAGRRVGHVVAVLVNLLLLYLINVSPGWDAVPFLTGETVLVLGLVNLSLWASVVAEALYVVWDAVWLRALGDIVTMGISLAATVRIWQVFPFDLTSGWEMATRVLLGIAVFGTLVGIAVALARLIRSLAAPTRTT